MLHTLFFLRLFCLTAILLTALTSFGHEFCLCIKDGGATTYNYTIVDGTDCCESTAGDLGILTHWEQDEHGTWISVSTESIGGSAAQKACCTPSLQLPAKTF